MLSTPPAFILSQDQTLMLIVVWTCQNFFWHSYLCLDSSLNFSLLPSFRSSAFGIFRVALLFICQGTRLSFAQSIELRSNHWTLLNLMNFRSITKTFVFVCCHLSATAYSYYHKLFALSTTFLTFFEIFFRFRRCLGVFRRNEIEYSTPSSSCQH